MLDKIEEFGQGLNMEMARDCVLGSWSRTIQLALLLVAAGFASALIAAAKKL